MCKMEKKQKTSPSLALLGHVASIRHEEEGPAGQEPVDRNPAYLWLTVFLFSFSFPPAALWAGLLNAHNCKQAITHTHLTSELQGLISISVTHRDRMLHALVEYAGIRRREETELLVVIGAFPYRQRSVSAHCLFDG